MRFPPLGWRASSDAELVASESVSVDGYFGGAGGDLNWAHEQSDDPEFHDYIERCAQPGGC
jgi:hypothetical protein